MLYKQVGKTAYNITTPVLEGVVDAVQNAVVEIVGDVVEGTADLAKDTVTEIIDTGKRCYLE